MLYVSLVPIYFITENVYLSIHFIQLPLPSNLLLVITNLISFYVSVSVFLFFFSISITVQLFYNVLVSTVQQSESIIFIHMPPLFWISFPFRSPQRTEFPVLHSRFSLVICFIHGINSVQMSIPVSRVILPPFPTWYPCVCSLCLCLYFCFVNKIAPFF